MWIPKNHKKSVIIIFNQREYLIIFAFVYSIVLSLCSQHSPCYKKCLIISMDTKQRGQNNKKKIMQCFSPALVNWSHRPIDLLLPFYKKMNLALDVIYSSTMNLDICVSRFIVIGCVIFETKLIFYEMEGLIIKLKRRKLHCVDIWELLIN